MTASFNRLSPYSLSFFSFAELILLTLEGSWVVCRQLPREMQDAQAWKALDKLLCNPFALVPLESKRNIAAKAGGVLVKAALTLLEISQPETCAEPDKRTLALLACLFVDALNALLEHPERKEATSMAGALCGACVDTSGVCMTELNIAIFQPAEVMLGCIKTGLCWPVQLLCLLHLLHCLMCKHLGMSDAPSRSVPARHYILSSESTAHVSGSLQHSIAPEGKDIMFSNQL